MNISIKTKKMMASVFFLATPIFFAISAFFTISVFFSTSIVMAADTSTLNITGNVIASPCTVDADNAVMNIKLDDIQATTLAEAGAGSPWKNFSLTLKNCPASTSYSILTFSGTPDPLDNQRYKNTGTATNLSVELTGAGGANFGNGRQLQSQPVNAATKEITIPMRTRAYTASGNVMPGTINSAVTVAFTYK